MYIKVLYDLKAKGIANRSDSNPPLWKLIKNVQQVDSFQISQHTVLDPAQELSNTVHMSTSTFVLNLYLKTNIRDT